MKETNFTRKIKDIRSFSVRSRLWWFFLQIDVTVALEKNTRKLKQKYVKTKNEQHEAIRRYLID